MNQRQKAFCEAYIKTGNAAEAAREAGYSQRTAKSIGQRLLTFVDVQEYIRQRNEELDAEGVAKIAEIRRFWSVTMRDEKTKLPERLKASELLAKTYGAFLERFSVDGSIQSDVIFYLPRNGREQG